MFARFLNPMWVFIILPILRPHGKNKLLLHNREMTMGLILKGKNLLNWKNSVLSQEFLHLTKYEKK